MTTHLENLKKSLDAVLKIDSKATYRFEDCGSGTYVLNITISDEAAKTLTHEQLDKLDADLGLCNDEEADSIQERLGKHHGFFILLG